MAARGNLAPRPRGLASTPWIPPPALTLRWTRDVTPVIVCGMYHSTRLATLRVKAAFGKVAKITDDVKSI